MLKKNRTAFNWINRLSDMAIIYIAYLFSVWFWLFVMGNDTSNVALRLAVEEPALTLLLSFGFVVVFQYGGMYDSFRSKRIGAEQLSLFNLCLLCDVLVVGLIFLFKQADFSRGVMLVFAASSYLLLAAKRIVLRLFLRTLRKNGWNMRHVLLIGTGSLGEKYLEGISENLDFGYTCIGYVADGENPALGYRLGSYYQLPEILHEYLPDEAILALDQHDMGMINVIMANCEEQGIKTSIIPLYSEQLPACATVDVVGRVKLINTRFSPLDIAVNRIVKRLFDIVFSLFAILISSPILLLVSLGVRLSSPGPVIFRQERVGENQHPFQMFKFRSMILNDETDTAWSGQSDGRRTKFGAFIRKCSLDELPQFFNVLRGEMSVIGPRPELPFFVDKYKMWIPRYMVKHQVKPGITGWAQVNGYRGDTSIEKRIEFDIWYIENWSMALDLKILFLTVFGGMINKEVLYEEDAYAGPKR